MTAATRSRLTYLIAVSVLLLASGCTRLETAYALTAGERTARHNGQVIVVMEGAEIPQGFQEVAVVQAYGRTKAGLQKVIGALQRQARRLGCNALVNVHIDYGASSVSGSAIAGRMPPGSAG